MPRLNDLAPQLSRSAEIPGGMSHGHLDWTMLIVLLALSSSFAWICLLIWALMHAVQHAFS